MDQLVYSSQSLLHTLNTIYIPGCYQVDVTGKIQLLVRVEPSVLKSCT